MKLTHLVSSDIYIIEHLGYLNEGWLTVEFDITFKRSLPEENPPQPIPPVPNTNDPEEQRLTPFSGDLVYIDILTEEILKRHSGSHSPLSIRPKHESRMYILNGNETFQALIKKVCRLDSSLERYGL